jgi:hypothetical protein
MQKVNIQNDDEDNYMVNTNNNNNGLNTNSSRGVQYQIKKGSSLK